MEGRGAGEGKVKAGVAGSSMFWGESILHS